MGETAAEFETAAIVFYDQHPSSTLPRQTHQNVLCRAVSAHISERLTQDAGNLAAGRRRQAHLRHITNELGADTGVLTIARDHAREEIH